MRRFTARPRGPTPPKPPAYVWAAQAKIYGGQFSPNEGGVQEIHGQRNYQIRGVPRIYRIYVEPESPNEGGLFKTYHEPLSPNEGACLTCMLNRYRQLIGACSRYRMTCMELPNKRACYRYMVNRTKSGARYMVQDI